MDPGRVDLKDYVIESGKPFVIDEVEFQDPWDGKITVEKILLAYFAEQLPDNLPGWEQNPQRYVQPVWLFIGRSEKGGNFKLMVQAVIDKYLGAR